MASPPPPYNLAVIPVIASRHPLWEARLGEGTGRSSLDRGLSLDQGREALLTTVLDAEPDVIVKMPGDSLWPLLATLALGFSALLGHRWGTAALAGVATAGMLAGWLWPERALAQTAGERGDG